MPDFILSPLLESPLFQQLCDQLLEQPGAAAYEIGEGARAALAAAIAFKTGRQVLYIAPGDRDAARAAEDIGQYLPQGAGTMIARERQFARAVSSREGEWQRLTALSRLQSGEMRVLCLPADALLWRMTPPDVVRSMTVTVHTGERMQPSELMARLAVIAGDLACDTVRAIEAGTAKRTPQDNAKATYAPMLSKGMSPIDWTQRARYVIDQVRGLIPWPVATMEISGKTFKVFRVEQTGRTTDKAPGTLLAVTKQGLEVACGDGSVLVVRELQAEGGKRMAAADYFRGHPIEI